MEHCKVDQRAALDLEHSLGRCQRFLGVQQGCYGILPSTVVVWCTYYTYLTLTVRYLQRDHTPHWRSG
jgi:hypothetical protein